MQETIQKSAKPEFSEWMRNLHQKAAQAAADEEEEAEYWRKRNAG
jgi:hypothetical protein